MIMTPTETEQLKHLVSLLQAKLEGKTIERHCANCGPDYVCPRCKEWTDFRAVELCRYPDCYRLAPEPAPEKPKNILNENEKHLTDPRISEATVIHLEALMLARRSGKRLERRVVSSQWVPVDSKELSLSNCMDFRTVTEPAPEKQYYCPPLCGTCFKLHDGLCPELQKGCTTPPMPALEPVKDICEHCETEILAGHCHTACFYEKCCAVHTLISSGPVDIIPWPKPTPTYRPYKDASERPFFAGYRLKTNPKQTLFPLRINEIGITFQIHVEGHSVFFSWGQLFEYLEQTINGHTWGPAGKEITNE